MVKERRNGGMAMTALVLSGGGLSAVAEIGALQALEELHIPIDMIVGTSAGALIGALYASGMDAEGMQTMAASQPRQMFSVPWLQLALRTLRRRRLPLFLVDADRLWALTDPWLKGRSFQSTRIPLWVTATDLVQRHVVVFGPPESWFDETLATSLSVAKAPEPVDVAVAVRASTAVPGLFSPVRIADRILVDGGIGDDFPVDIAIMAGADRVIGVWIDEPTPWPVHHLSASGLIYQSMAVMIRQLSQVRQTVAVAPASKVIIRIPIEGSMTSLAAISRMMELGYRRTLDQRSDLFRLVA
jgi:NTE family protein